MDFSFRRLNTQDKAAIMTLQEQVKSVMPIKDHLVMTTEEEFDESLKCDLCLGAFAGDKLIGVTIMVVNRDSDRNLGNKMGLDPAKCVTLDTSFVAKGYVGHGLQRTFIEMRLNEAKKLGAQIALATVAPGNSYSISNLRSAGFRIYKKANLYGGYERFVLIKKIRR